MHEPLPYAKRLLSLLAAAGQVSVDDDGVHLGEKMQPWFAGEKTFSPPWNSVRAYFWQRLFGVVGETEPAFYRLGLPAAAWPPMLAKTTPPAWIFWIVAQFAAHRLMEEALVLAVDEHSVQRLDPEFLADSLQLLAPAKIPVSPEEGARVLERVQAAAENILAPRMEELRAEMAAVLDAELDRIRIYYESILKKNTLSEETRFLLQEREHLVQEHHRRLAPENLRVTLRVDFAAVLTILPP